jgi:hypothetical protein
MNRGEKIAASVLGILVFFGLFFFIYTSMKSSPSLPPVDEEVSDYENEDTDYDVAGDTVPVDDLEEQEPSPAPATDKPDAARPSGKK